MTDHVAIVIPARNEEDRIGACLASLAGQGGRIVLVVNNTTDATARIAREAAGDIGLSLDVLELMVAAEHGVGMARRIGCAHAFLTAPHTEMVLTTDADCILANDWVARNVAHLREVDAVCGRVEALASEAAVLGRMNPNRVATERRYRELVQRVYAFYAPNSADLQNSHGEVPGASLGIRASAYRSVGGFAPINCGEDRHIVRELRSAGFAIRHVEDVRTYVSCRLTGRAKGGMADALNARVGSENYEVDDCLPPADDLIGWVKAGTLGAWPPLILPAQRLKVDTLDSHIETLERFLTNGYEDVPSNELFMSSA